MKREITFLEEIKHNDLISEKYKKDMKLIKSY